MAWEADWTLRGFGAGTVFPDAWEEYLSFLPEDKRSDPVAEYHRILTTGTREEQLKAAYHWNKWELSISNLVRPGDAYDKLDQEDWNLQHARIEAHYFVNTCFLAGEKELSRKDNVERIAHLPGEKSRMTRALDKDTDNLPVRIVQGRYDIVCPAAAAWTLHKALPKSKLVWTIAGHSANVCIPLLSLRYR
jgi:proline iminopeptidase